MPNVMASSRLGELRRLVPSGAKESWKGFVLN